MSSFIFITDIHIRNSTSVRCDDILETQLGKLRWVLERARQLGVPVVHGGDLGHSFDWKVSALYSVGALIEEFNDVPFLTVIGNHDVPGRNISDLSGTGLGILSKWIPNFTILELGQPYTLGKFRFYGFHSDAPETEELLTGKLRVTTDPQYCNVAIIHAAVGAEETRWCRGHRDLSIEGFQYCCFGDIHSGWDGAYLSSTGAYLINPGSLTRLSIDSAQRTPYAVLIGTESVEFLPVPVKPPEEVFIALRNDETVGAVLGGNFVDAIASVASSGITGRPHIDQLRELGISHGFALNVIERAASVLSEDD